MQQNVFAEVCISLDTSLRVFCYGRDWSVKLRAVCGRSKVRLTARAYETVDCESAVVLLVVVLNTENMSVV
jgi:hypothetical protein